MDICPSPHVCQSVRLQLKPFSYLFCKCTQTVEQCDRVGFSGSLMRGEGVVYFPFVWVFFSSFFFGSVLVLFLVLFLFFGTCVCEQNDHCSTRMLYLGRAVLGPGVGWVREGGRVSVLLLVFKCNK